MKINTLVLDVNGFLTKELDYLHTLKQGFFNFMGLVMKTKEEIKERQAKYRAEHKECLREQKASYYLGHKEKINIRVGKGHKQRRLVDPLFKMVGNLRNRINHAFTNIKLNKPTKTETLLGADWKTVMFHIQSQFTFGMSWDKVGKEIHIDHKIPLAKAKTEKQLIKLCRYTNLQPLWSEDNLRKQDKTDYTTNNL